MRRAALISSAIWLAVASGAMAQTPVDPAQQTLRAMEREQTMKRLEQAPESAMPAAPRATGPVHEASCFPIKTIEMEGIQLIDPWDIEVLIARYRGQCLGEQSLGALIGEINGAYASRGYITSKAYLPEQNLNTGLLKLVVVEGKIEKIVHVIVDEDGNESDAPIIKTRLALSAREGQPLNLRDLEQGLDNINRMSSSQSALDLMPGTTTGGSIVVIKERKGNRLRTYLGADNAGALSTGNYRVRASVEGDDLAYVNDQWALSLTTSENSNGATAQVSLPIGYWTLSLTGSYFESQNLLTQTALLYSQTANANARVERLVWRDATTKIRMIAGLQHFWNGRLVNASELTPSERTSVRLATATELHLPGSVAQIELGLSRGVPQMFAIADLSQGAASAPDLGFTKLDASLYWIKAFEWGRIVANVQAQYTNDVLLSPDQLTIGGWESVRGYHGVEVAGDKGVLARTEFIFSMPSLGFLPQAMAEHWERHKKKIEPFAFVDSGRIWSNADATLDVSMLGVGAGLRFNSERALFEVAGGAPLVDVPGLEDDWQIYGNITVKLY